MRIVIQRVKQAKVEVEGSLVGEIAKGLLIFLGVDKDDSPEDVGHLVDKVTNLRVFEDTEGKMNLSALEAEGEFLVVSQFTLLGNCQKGRRPSFDRVADPQKGELLYEGFVQQLRNQKVKKVATGRFRAMMDVSLVNDGPVTFILESRFNEIKTNERP